MIKKISLLIVSALILAGCGKSGEWTYKSVVPVFIHPLSSSKVVADDDMLDGSWVDRELYLETRYRGDGQYQLTISPLQKLKSGKPLEKSEQVHLNGILFRVDDHLFLDLQLSPKNKFNPLALTFFCPARQAYLVQKQDDKILLSIMSRKATTRYLDDHPDMGQYVENDNFQIITSDTPEIQSLLGNLADNDNIFKKEGNLILSPHAPLTKNKEGE